MAALLVGACQSSKSGDTSSNDAEPNHIGASGSSAGDASHTGTGNGGTGGAPATCSSEPTHSGQATFYTTADGTGNCSFDATPNDLMIGAMNATDYAASAACGACAHLSGPNGELTIRVVDQCPECPQGNIDLSPVAFDKIAQRAQGRVPITWQYVGCTVTGSLAYRFKEGSSQYWTAVQVRNHRYRVAKFEYLKSGSYVNVHREEYDYFVEPAGMGPGPYTFRVTDIYGDAVIDQNIALQVAQVVPGSVQFPECQ
jgi:expansin (peptidoglycan-binding protein)